MNVKASIIIPVYNAETTLRRCVESIVYGYERNVQVILTEDCSRDNSWDLCQTLAREYPNVIAVQNPQNSGVSYTRNRGLSLAQGQYVLFVDSDDWVSGMYVHRLLQTVENHPDALVLCGFRFHDNTAGYQQDYIWDKQAGPVCEVGKADFFALQAKVLLQSPCNKIFHRDIIRNRELRFDEAQSMGEDFQFVLDYMEAAGTRRCVVVNAPLYHYIRATNTSLMSNYGPESRHQGQARLAKLYRLSGGDADTAAQYEAALEKLKENYIYHMVHSDKLSVQEKKSIITELIGPHAAQEIFRNHQRILWKERIVAHIGSIRRLPAGIMARISRVRRDRKVRGLLRHLKKDNFTILSQNCIGGVFYHDMGMAFSSPTIDLFFMAPDFMKFVLNLNHYLHCQLQMQWGETYPVGILDDITVHFMHYDTCSEARASWERRCKRVQLNKIIVICTDRNGFDDDLFDTWLRIPYPKVLYTVHSKYCREPGSVCFPEYQNQGFVPDLIPGREFYKDGVLINTIYHLGGQPDDPIDRR